MSTRVAFLATLDLSRGPESVFGVKVYATVGANGAGLDGIETLGGVPVSVDLLRDEQVAALLRRAMDEADRCGVGPALDEAPVRERRTE